MSHLTELERLRHAPLRDLSDSELEQAHDRGLVAENLYILDCRRRFGDRMREANPVFMAAGLAREG
jgi:hypothetical protein